MNFKLQCFPFHQWSAWKTTDRGIVQRMRFGMYLNEPTDVGDVGQYLHQERKCSVCHKIELRVERALLP